MEEGIDYRVGAEGNILQWNDLTKATCADIAASVIKNGQLNHGGLYWSYKASEKRCFVKKTNGNPTSDSSIVSGSKDCGIRIPGKLQSCLDMRSVLTPPPLRILHFFCTNSHLCMGEDFQLVGILFLKLIFRLPN